VSDRELVERLAREAGYPVSLMKLAQMQAVERLIASVAGECAKLCLDRTSEAEKHSGPEAAGWLENAAAAICERFGIGGE
jgi:hypothetical protein